MNRINESNLKTTRKRQIRSFLSRSWGLLGPLWSVLGWSRAALGRFWGLLGGSWGLLGPLGTVLAAILGPPDHKIENQTVTLNLRKLFGTILEPQMGPKTTPRRPQNESKIKTKNA